MPHQKTPLCLCSDCVTSRLARIRAAERRLLPPPELAGPWIPRSILRRPPFGAYQLPGLAG